MKINKIYHCSKFILSEAAMQGLFHPAEASLDISLCDFSLSSGPQHRLKVILLLNPTCFFEVCL